MINPDPLRWAAAAALVAAYALMCFLLARARRPAEADRGGEADWLVAYASQTGTGEFLAQQTVATLHTGGLAARMLSLEHLREDDLRSAGRILFIVSTYGEGDAPDSAERFARMLAATSFSLAQLHYGVLALGDSTYAQFCGYGRSLDAALSARGATPLFARIDVDRAAPPAIEQWQHHLSHLAGTSDAPDWSAPAYGQWRIAQRRQLNPGSAGAPVFEIVLRPADDRLPEWEAGDLVQLSAPGEPEYPREYSIASLPSEGSLRLLVRLHVRDDGSEGLASGWLCTQAGEGDAIALRVRPHARFRLGENAGRPLILIGNGTGIAGLRAHLLARLGRDETRNWLVFGERNAAHDFFWREEIERWQQSGRIEALDLAFSRDGGPQRYVQHVLAQRGNALRAWVAQGAAIYVCGSLHGMAAGVHEALVTAVGADKLQELADMGRYRRDVY